MWVFDYLRIWWGAFQCRFFGHKFNYIYIWEGFYCERCLFGWSAECDWQLGIKDQFEPYRVPKADGDFLLRDFLDEWSWSTSA